MKLLTFHSPQTGSSAGASSRRQSRRTMPSPSRRRLSAGSGIGQNLDVEPLRITDDAVLRPFEESDAAELTAAIAANREHLARWLPWAGDHGFEDSVDYVARKVAQREEDDGFEGAIVLDGRIVGGAGFHRVDWINRAPRSATGSPPTCRAAA